MYIKGDFEIRTCIAKKNLKSLSMKKKIEFLTNNYNVPLYLQKSLPYKFFSKSHIKSYSIKNEVNVRLKQNNKIF